MKENENKCKKLTFSIVFIVHSPIYRRQFTNKSVRLIEERSLQQTLNVAAQTLITYHVTCQFEGFWSRVGRE